MVVSCCLTGLLAGCGSTAAPSSEHRTSVQVSVSSCGQGWSRAEAGRVDLRLRDTDTRPGEMRLVDPRTDAVLADVEPLGPGTSRDLSLVLDPGTYVVRCYLEDEAPVTGRPVRVTGQEQADASEGVVPADQASLVPATKAYEAWVRGRLPALQRQAARLRDAVRRSDLPAARTAWLDAHATYQSLGAAYGAFGDLGEAVDGLPDGLARGTADPGWHGFHRLELGLWRRGTTAGLGAEADRLVRDVGRLRTTFATAQVDPADVTLRAHEIVEDTLQRTLSGRDDLGSHSALVTTRANLRGVDELLGVLRPLLAERHVDVAALRADVRRTDALAARLQRPSAHSPRAVADLPRRDREQLSADVADLAERLAPVATVLEPRRTS